VAFADGIAGFIFTTVPEFIEVVAELRSTSWTRHMVLVVVLFCPILAETIWIGWLEPDAS